MNWWHWDGSDDDLWNIWKNPSYDKLHHMLTELRDRAERRGYTYYAQLYERALSLLQDANTHWEIHYEELINMFTRNSDDADDLMGRPDDDF